MPILHTARTAPPPSNEYASVKRAMASLPAAEREVLVLWNSGMDYGEIAERTEHSADTVGMLLSQARKRLVASYDVLKVGTKEPAPRGPWWTPWRSESWDQIALLKGMQTLRPVLLEPNT